MAELILALDLTDRDKALDIAEEVSDYISAIKVNYPLVLSAGVEIIDELSKIKPVIADFKIADIPYTSSLIADITFKNGAKGIIVHGFAGRETVKAVLDVATNYGGEVYVVTELTSSTEYFSGISDKIAEMAKELECHGIVAPGTRPERVKELREIVKDLKILCPGIGAQGGDVRKVVEAGADYVIVGRSIYNSKNPKKTAKEILELLKS
jgi:orotidine-5'-phosphate decarboxylase